MTFWILTLILSLLAMGFVCFPLMRSNVSIRTELESEHTLYQARLLEIEKDLELGRLDEVSAQAAKSEEARKLIKSSEVEAHSTVSHKNRALVILAALSLPIFSLPYYYSTGSHQVVNSTVVQVDDGDQLSIEDLLKVAEKRLQSNPDDVDGWKVVVPVYMRMKRYQDAENAYQNILRVEGRSAEYLLKLADVYIEQEQGQINDKAKSLITEVLSVDKENAIAKFYTGIIELQNDNLEGTRQIWQTMIDGAKGDEEWLPVIKGRLAELGTLEKPEVSEPDFNQETANAIQEMNPEDRLEAIGQMVANLADKLEANPNNKAGWQRLIRSYLTLGRNDEAKTAGETAAKQFPEDEAFLASIQNMLRSVENSQEGAAQ